MNISTTAVNGAIAGQKVAAPGALTKPSDAGTVKEAKPFRGESDPQGGSSKELQDTIELSAEAFRLSQTRKAEARKDADAETREAVEKLKAEAAQDAETSEAISGDEREGSWQTQRNARLDRLQTMVRQGLYKVDPFMLDELAIRMVRMVG